MMRHRRMRHCDMFGAPSACGERNNDQVFDTGGGLGEE